MPSPINSKIMATPSRKVIWTDGRHIQTLQLYPNRIMSKKHKKRSVAIQSTDLFNLESEVGQIRVTLKKRPGFRNLLQQSLTILSHRHKNETPNIFYPRQRSKSVQASMETEFSYYGGEQESVQNLTTKILSSEADTESRKTTFEVKNSIESKKETSKPGPSGIGPGGHSTHSVVSQMSNVSLTHREGSLTVTYHYGEKKAENSMTSTIFYGSQGSRRFSDETVILIEDYQSYDQANALRRQPTPSHRRSVIYCCSKNSRRYWDRGSSEALTKPLPIEFERLEEIVCRICHEGEDLEPLIQPCLCKGSVGYVHASCLKLWLEQSSTSRCELCNYPYAIRQTRRYTKCVSVRVFYKTIIDRRALIYDVISFVVITPLTLVAVVMCIQASVVSGSSPSSGSNYQIGYITKIGMAMLCGTIAIAYTVWLYTLISYHYKSWRKWYDNCYDVEVIPVRMTSEERIIAFRRLNEEMNRRHLSREQGSIVVTFRDSSRTFN